MAKIHEVHHEHEGNPAITIMGIVLLVLAVIIFLYYLTPVLRGATQLNFPSKIDVNIQQGS